MTSLYNKPIHHIIKDLKDEKDELFSNLENNSFSKLERLKKIRDYYSYEYLNTHTILENIQSKIKVLTQQIIYNKQIFKEYNELCKKISILNMLLYDVSSTYLEIYINYSNERNFNLDEIWKKYYPSCYYIEEVLVKACNDHNDYSRLKAQNNTIPLLCSSNTRCYWNTNNDTCKCGENTNLWKSITEVIPWYDVRSFNCRSPFQCGLTYYSLPCSKTQYLEYYIKYSLTDDEKYSSDEELILICNIIHVKHLLQDKFYRKKSYPVDSIVHHKHKQNCFFKLGFKYCSCKSSKMKFKFRHDILSDMKQFSLNTKDIKGVSIEYV